VEAVTAGELVLIAAIARVILQTYAAFNNALGRGNIVGNMRDRMRNACRR
jgi:hypothetical protein